MGRGNFEGEKGWPTVKYRDSLVSAVSCAKTAEPIEMQFGMLSQVGPGTMY